MAAILCGGDTGGAGASKRIKHDIAHVGIEAHHPFGQRNGEGGRMTHPFGRFGGNLPDGEGCGHKLIAANVRCAPIRARKLFFGKDEQILMQIAQPWRFGTLPTAPGTIAAGPFGLLPDHFAHRQKTNRVMHFIKVGVQGNIRFTPQVGNVDHIASTGQQDAVNFLGHLTDQGEIGGHTHVAFVIFPHIIGR